MESDIALQTDQLEVFITLLEEYPNLWNTQNPDYKNKHSKSKARIAIASAMGLGWTSEQVKRKLDSVRAQFRRTSKKMKASTGAPGTGKSGGPFFDRLKSMFDTMEYQDTTSSNLPPSTIITAKPEIVTSDEDANAEYDDGDAEPSPDISLFQQRVCLPVTCSSQCSVSTTAVESRGSSVNTDGNLQGYLLIMGKRKLNEATMPIIKRPVLDETHKTGTDKLETVTVELANSSTSATTCNPYDHFGATVSQRLNSIASPRIREECRFAIECALHQSVLKDLDEKQNT